ncbi:hypothetical protein GLOIN_2v1702956 [Rhizophagus irregularis DAOM 181602=DAOM 197198]|uniref:Uncharacterized protein n=1 Tax=Rhizophagus irregularis (strain DAOM 181602 / DAOM 197198 / MUCL 43194) TaxID=747089 RepID=A0A2P4P879_RHIID|nr:hypothetical protein GLOIN_2v1702956 [Rhizophagus irregularis DAOM 181602=DAOM 197198]POG61589.1 hypothetical protein GLOIN_2v1702956 [Rhizophagus irregularis DAOM 181602=DAOM 197198]|eukprot:XP_025168455.1 hypothetical protein GLOIN_2v1702956 [Rhizophagus irregularis DAOM 181602=DAOM 197198]
MRVLSFPIKALYDLVHSFHLFIISFAFSLRLASNSESELVILFNPVQYCLPIFLFHFFTIILHQIITRPFFDLGNMIKGQ